MVSTLGIVDRTNGIENVERGFESREHSRAHPSPVCGRPAIGQPWLEIVSVCDDCHLKAMCSDGRLVAGYNADFFGGFESMHIDDRSICEQFTHDGLVWVDGRQCQMGETKFGGVFVGIKAALGGRARRY